MELELQKDSFLDDVRNIRSIRGKKPERSEGFIYLHQATTQKLFDDKGFCVKDIDFSKFTYDDLKDYMQYYDEVLSERIRTAEKLFEAIEAMNAKFRSNVSFH